MIVSVVSNRVAWVHGTGAAWFFVTPAQAGAHFDFDLERRDQNTKIKMDDQRYALL